MTEKKRKERGMKRTERQLQPERKRVLARLKKPGMPLKTIRLMKYVKAHKETLRPFRREGGGGGGGDGGWGGGA